MFDAGSSTTRGEEFQAVIDRLIHQFSPTQIYLFGSHAYGQPTIDSDVDVLVVVDRPCSEIVACHRRGYDALRGVRLPIELHFCTRDRFERFGGLTASVYHEIRNRGRLLHQNSECGTVAIGSQRPTP
ncbi:MAG: nucleotidyltransferase domain-containing protein [Phycisphaerae bacterium]